MMVINICIALVTGKRFSLIFYLKLKATIRILLKHDTNHYSLPADNQKATTHWNPPPIDTQKSYFNVNVVLSP